MYFKCLEKQNNKALGIPAKFVNDSLLFAKTMSKTRLKGYALKKALKAPWKFSLEEVLRNWSTTNQRV